MTGRRDGSRGGTLTGGVPKDLNQPGSELVQQCMLLSGFSSEDRKGQNRVHALGFFLYAGGHPPMAAVWCLRCAAARFNHYTDRAKQGKVLGVTAKPLADSKASFRHALNSGQCQEISGQSIYPVSPDPTQSSAVQPRHLQVIAPLLCLAEGKVLAEYLFNDRPDHLYPSPLVARGGGTEMEAAPERCNSGQFASFLQLRLPVLL
ncbi:unnamed protein product [Pleuronectes platessa]|uniref:Uncharacterized protein n=1 Tax=Pleuronectes platessa TaxID=8262 RepID=A0A9N7VIG1_PLEPL|nr:unnamed protein product [Pleuronectes platessa]